VSLDTERSSTFSTVGKVLGTSPREGPTQQKYLQPLHVMTETEFPKLWMQKLILLTVCLFTDELY